MGRVAPLVEETWDSEGEGDRAVGAGPEAEGEEGACGVVAGPVFFVISPLTCDYGYVYAFTSGGRGNGVLPLSRPSADRKRGK